jgi:hypothetical protein
MKVLEKFEERLRYKNYADRSIKLYSSYLKLFLEGERIKDPYQVRTKQIVSFLEKHPYTSSSQQNQYIGALKLFAKHILGKKDLHLSKIERPRSEKKPDFCLFVWCCLPVWLSLTGCKYYTL